MSRRQDYVARVRYQNHLPPPPCAPKLIETSVDLTRLLSAGALSSAVVERPLYPDYDIDLGIPIDLSQVPHAFEAETTVFDAQPEAELDPRDAELLVEPASSSGVSGTGSGGDRSASPGVSFLRRTEYISADAARKVSSINRARIIESTPEDQLRRIEQTFEEAQRPLSELRHPKKKSARAVRSWKLLPDTKTFDLQYLTVRMVGSASLKNRKEPVLPAKLGASLFQNLKAGDGPDADEWIGFFVPETESVAQDLATQLADTQDTLTTEQAADQAAKMWNLEKVQDYDLDFNLHEDDYEELAITADDESQSAYYLPVRGRAALKRRRVEQRKQALLKEYNLDGIEFGLREVTAEESIDRDAARSTFDPVTYGTDQ